MFTALFMFLGSAFKNPKVLLAIAAIVVLGIFYSYADGKGYARAETEYKAELAQLRHDQKEELDEANTKVTNLTTELGKLGADLELKYTKELNNANEKIADLKARAAKGGVGFSLAGKCGGTSGVRQPATTSPVGAQGSGAPEPAKVPVGEGRCELDPSVGIALVDLAAEGDRAKRKVNYLIDFYTSIQKAGGCDAKDFKGVERIQVSADGDSALFLKQEFALNLNHN